MYGFRKELFGIAWYIGKYNIQHKDSLETVSKIKIEHDIFGLDLKCLLKTVSNMDLGEGLVVKVALLWKGIGPD